MTNSQNLKGKTIFITGASRGIGKAIALRCARDGAFIILASKSESEGKLPGTIYSAAEDIEKAGGTALPLPLDLRIESSIQDVVKKVYEKTDKIDALINNAGAISLTPVEMTPTKKLDLMFSLNVRAVLALSHYFIPALKKANGAHILNLSPPLSLDPKWLPGHTPYSISKYGMSLATLGMAEELRDDKIAVNSLWPRTLIASAATKMLFGEDGMKNCRTEEIMADAAYEILCSDPTKLTGQLLLDEGFLKTKGYTDFNKYRVDPQTEPSLDLYVAE